MATVTTGAVDVDVRGSINILSLDAGGAQAISQLRILEHLMEKISQDDQGASEGMVKRPCEVFDVIGGVGTGGLIAIFLVVLKMTATEALEEFTKFAIEVYKDADRDTGRQTKRLKGVLKGILERHKLAKETKLIPEDQPTPTCKLIVPIMYKNNIGVTCVLRNHVIRQEPPTNLTLAEAMFATSAIAPMFTPISIGKDFSTFEYVSGDLGLSNPIREVIAGAHQAFGNEATVACLLSIGCGHARVNSLPGTSNSAARIDFLEQLAMDCEKVAQDVGSQMSQLPIYHRLSVNYGLEQLKSRAWTDPEISIARTTVYLKSLEVVELVDRCVDSIKTGHGSATLERLRYSGGATILPPPLPPLTVNYVERKASMKFVMDALFDQNVRIKSGSKRIVVTGIGGCGKTQLIRKFVENNQDHFISTFVVDGSSKDTLRRDLVRHVRSLNAAHSQDSFEDAMTFLSHSTLEGQRLLIIDNVDDPAIDLAPFFPRWENGVVIVTSRNASRGQLSPSTHLQLDVMSLDEAVELLVRGSGREWPPSAADKATAITVAEELGCHPIALVQAISYMASTGYSADIYITRLRGYREVLLKDPATNQLDMRYMSAFAAFDASYHILPSSTQKTLHLLSLCHRQNFPLELVILAAEGDFSTDRFNYIAHGDAFEQGKRYLRETFCPSSQSNLHELDSIVMSLRNQSLVTVVPTMNFTLLEMHSLAHEWSRFRVPREILDQVQAAAIRLLCCGVSRDNHRMMQHLANHVVALSSAWGALSANDAASFGFILEELGVYADAVRLKTLAHEVVQSQLGGDHLDSIVASANLAITYSKLGRHAEAEVLQLEVLRQRKQQLGTDHPGTINASANLAITYGQLGRYAEAEVLELDVLRQRKQQLGIDHPDTILASANLAVTYGQLGRYAEAEVLELDVLRQRKQQLGTDHPDTINASANMAVIYGKLGRHAEAEVLELEVLRQRKQQLGTDHPDTINASANMAVIYGKLGRHAEAEVLELEVLRQRKQQLGTDHPHTILASANLAVTYEKLGRHVESEVLRQEVLKQRKQQLGINHPDTIDASANLAVTYTKLGRYAEAEVLQLEVLRQRKQQLGLYHPETIDASSNLAVTWCLLGRFAEAKVPLTEVLRSRKLILGSQHPDTLKAMELLVIIERRSKPSRRDRILARLRRLFLLFRISR